MVDPKMLNHLPSQEPRIVMIDALALNVQSWIALLDRTFPQANVVRYAQVSEMFLQVARQHFYVK